ncbi:rRNA-processing protein FYV7-like [Cucumis melo var. makuwa]|nr:rRNA-processing protein FYV7-like [Cucumis melo var. makuwa]TYK18255.1 rRNA-processing protein FYV7-like [Cucumis melo var. makuwa]
MGENETKFENQTNGRCGKERNKGVPSLQALYERKHEEKEKARMEKEAIIAAKKEERERAKARRNSTREKMFKRTQKGQPVMKYRIEHLLETIGASTNH